MDDAVFTIYDIDILLSEAESAIYASDVHAARKKLRTARQIITDMRQEILAGTDRTLEQFNIIK